MRKTTFICLILITAILFAVTASQAEVNFKIQKQLKLKNTPIDIKMSQSGRWLYVLTKDGLLSVYSQKGAFIGKMAVGKDFDQVEPGPLDEEIYLKSSSKNTVLVLELAYDHTIHIKGSPYKGREDAPIVIVDYTDFQCPYCARLLPVFEELLKRYPDKLKIVYKNFPLRGHPFAQKAASAAMAAHLNGKFWPFHDKLFANFHRMSDAVIKDIRKELKFNTKEFELLMASPKVLRLIQQDILQGQNIGVKSTPTVFVNGKRQNNKRLEGFIETIENELQKLK